MSVTGHVSVRLLSFSDFLTVSLPVLGLTRYKLYSAADDCDHADPAAAMWSSNRISSNSSAADRSRQMLLLRKTAFWLT